jgi:tRNA G46 methylase TrmB
MGLTRSFKFVDGHLNRRVLSLMKKARINHVMTDDGVAHFSPDDEELVENDLLGSIRNEVFSSWQILSCPRDWTERYRQYMLHHDIPFREELENDQLCFLLPLKYRPHSWKLAEPRSGSKVHMAR